jgi:hypothetical protein
VIIDGCWGAIFIKFDSIGMLYLARRRVKPSDEETTFGKSHKTATDDSVLRLFGGRDLNADSTSPNS